MESLGQIAHEFALIVNSSEWSDWVKIAGGRLYLHYCIYQFYEAIYHLLAKFATDFANVKIYGVKHRPLILTSHAFINSVRSSRLVCKNQFNFKFLTKQLSTFIPCFIGPAHSSVVASNQSARKKRMHVTPADSPNDNDDDHS